MVKEIKTELRQGPLNDVRDIGKVLPKMWGVWLLAGREFWAEGIASSMCSRERTRCHTVTKARIGGM